MTKVAETVKKVLDPDKIKKNAIDGLGVVTGIALGLLIHNIGKGKLPLAKFTDPLLTLLPGAAGSILLDPGFTRSMALGVTSVGVADGISKAISAIPFLSFAAPYAPKITNTQGGGVGRLGELDKRSGLLYGLGNTNMQERTQIPVSMM